MNSLGRRQFLKGMGGGLIVFFSTDLSAQAQSRKGSSRGSLPSSDFNAYLQVKEDGRVACFTGKVELGQGIITSLAQMLAEELDLSLNSIDMVMGDTDLCPYDAGTYGSRSTKYFGPLLREAAARARSILLEMAAARLGIPRERLTITEGVIQDPKQPEKKVAYADLVKGTRIEKGLEVKAEPKPYSAFKVSGKPAGRTDGLPKVTGRAQFSGDIRLPDMLYARILRPPAHGATLKKIDTSAAEKIKGLKVIRDGDFLAVLHPIPDLAETGLALIKAQFTVPPGRLDEKTLFPYLLKVAPEGSVVSQEGSLEKGEKGSARKFEESYFQHYVAHAPMETHTTLTWVEGKKATVWALHPDAFRRQGGRSRGSFHPLPGCARDHPFCGGRFRREDLEPAGRRGGPPVPTNRETGASRLDKGRRVFLRCLPARRRGEDSIRPRFPGPDHLLGLPGLFCRRPGCGYIL